MSEKQFDLIPLLDYIDPSVISYSDWLAVGMALKTEGYDLSVWDEWSRADSRYHRGECERKWYGFESDGITGATITQMAKDGGWLPKSKEAAHAIEWDDAININVPVVIATGYKAQDVPDAPDEWNPNEQLLKYVQALFRAGDPISVTMLANYDEEDDKWKPGRAYSFTYESLVKQLTTCSDIGYDYNPEAGAWICFNPLSGDRKNENVTDYRYALVESDAMGLDEQYGLIRELQLPCAAIVNSGKKSIHAIVRVDAPDEAEYKKRVEFLYKVLQRNGMRVDTQNKNPARLSRMPGIMRAGKKQYLISTHTGLKDWDSWIEFIGDLDDDYPEIERFDSEVFENPPELPPIAIEGLAYRGNIVEITGASKSGKTCTQGELAVAISEGGQWLGRQCTKGSVLYINFEVDKAPMVHRIADIYNALHITPTAGFDLWHLRGTAVTLEQFVPRLLKRIKRRKYDCIIIDPLYKLNDGDENSAGDMSRLFVQLDKIAACACDEGATVVISHHYSKGSQGSKASMDRASGSGVFARAPDLIISMDELAPTDEMIDEAVEAYGIDPDAVRLNGAYRLEYTVRYFATPKPQGVWFQYPIHVFDSKGILDNAELMESSRGVKHETKSAEELLDERLQQFDDVFDMCSFDGKEALVRDMCNAMKLTEGTLTRKRLTEYKKYGCRHYEKKGEKVRLLPY